MTPTNQKVISFSSVEFTNFGWFHRGRLSDN